MLNQMTVTLAAGFASWTAGCYSTNIQLQHGKSTLTQNTWQLMG